MILELEDVTHEYGDERALTDVSLEIPEGELIALLGPSGCGKTTIVGTIAGHLTPTEGRVRLRGDDVTTRRPEHRQVGIVFQQLTLFPHMTVHENVAYGLHAGHVSSERREETVAEYLDLVELSAYHDSYPDELSGGQQRRVELARALAPEPDILLLDEPLAALDRSLRRQLREEIGRIQRETGVTTLYVTHDQTDAMALADRLVLLQDGTVSATGEPRTLYQSPPNPFVASFLGRSNLLSATLLERDPPVLRFGGTTLRGDDLSEMPTGGGDLRVHVRPADLTVTPGDGVQTGIRLSGTARSVRDLGHSYDVTVELASGETVVATQRRSPPAVGDPVILGTKPAHLTVFFEA